MQYSTFQKWQREFDWECKTITWLDCETVVEGGTKVVKKLKCKVCTKFRSQILCKRNFSDQWISGADFVRISNIRDHASSEQHNHAMALLQREAAAATGQSSTSSAPIVVALTSLSEDEKVRLRHKFDIAYWLAVEKISFRKFPSVCNLETQHGVNIGTTYTTETAAKSFIGYIAQAREMN